MVGGKGGGCRRKYGMMVFLVFGAAIFGVTILHKFRERRIFSILIKEKDQQLLTLQLLLQRERDLNHESDKKIQELKAKVYALSSKKIDLDSKLLELQSTISSLKDEHSVLESSLKDKEDEIKMLGEASAVLTQDSYHHHQEKTSNMSSSSVSTEADDDPSTKNTTADVGSERREDHDRIVEERIRRETKDLAKNEGESKGKNLTNYQEGEAEKLDSEVVADEKQVEISTGSGKDLGRKHGKGSSKTKSKKWREFMTSRRSVTSNRKFKITGDSSNRRIDLSHDDEGFKTEMNQHNKTSTANKDYFKPKDEPVDATVYRVSNTQSNEMPNNIEDTETKNRDEDEIKSQDNQENATDRSSTTAPNEQPKQLLETASDVEIQNPILQTTDGAASKGIMNKDDRTPEDTESSVDYDESNTDQIINKDEGSNDPDNSTARDSDAIDLKANGQNEQETEEQITVTD